MIVPPVLILPSSPDALNLLCVGLRLAEPEALESPHLVLTFKPSSLILASATEAAAGERGDATVLDAPMKHVACDGELVTIVGPIEGLGKSELEWYDTERCESHPLGRGGTGGMKSPLPLAPCWLV